MHYILALDMSGSMDQKDNNGKTRWENLIEAVKQFMIYFDADPLVKSNSVVSIITYDKYSYVKIKGKTPSASLIESLSFSKGATSFGPPLKDIKTLIESCFDNHDVFTVFFMSDGEESYPEEEVQELKD